MNRRTQSTRAPSCSKPRRSLKKQDWRNPPSESIAFEAGLLSLFDLRLGFESPNQYIVLNDLRDLK